MHTLYRRTAAATATVTGRKKEPHQRVSSSVVHYWMTPPAWA